MVICRFHIRAQTSRPAALVILTMVFWWFSGAVYAAEGKAPIRFGILSIAQPSRIFHAWTPFVEYLSKHLKQPVEIVVPRGFKKMKTAVETGRVDFFYINSHVFYRLKQAGKAQALAQMKNLDNKTTSRSEIFVRRDKKITTPLQLKGQKIAFVSPMGAGGYLAPRAFLYSQGINTKEDVVETFTSNLSNSIYGVILGDMAAGAMCGVNYRLMSEKIETGKLKILGVTGEYPENVIAVRTDFDRQLAGSIRDIVTSMKQDTVGRSVINDMHSQKILDFVAYDENIEKITRELLRKGRF